VSHRFPQFLPDGRRFLFYSYGSDNTRGIYLGSLDDQRVTFLVAADTQGAYAAPGWVFYSRQGALVASRFDVERGVFSGDPVAVADPVAIEPTVLRGAFDVAANGLVTYRTSGRSPRQLTWFDRSGKALGTLGAADDTQIDPVLAPDGRRAAVARVMRGTDFDIWVIDAGRATRFTFEPEADRYPVWSPDGSHIAFARMRDSHVDFYAKPSSGSGSEQLLLQAPLYKILASWAPDAGSLLFSQLEVTTGYDLWALPCARPRLQGRGDRFCSPHRPSRLASSRGTAAGWPTNRTSRAGWKSTCVR
jgi:Tol biopolymer transport system component